MPDIFEEALAPTLEQRPRAAQRLALQVETDCPEGDEAAHRAKVIFKLFFINRDYHYHVYYYSRRNCPLLPLQVGRWTMDSISALNSFAFWMMMHIMSLCRQPIDHMSNWLMKAEGERHSHRRDMPTFVEFVCGFAPDLRHKWDGYLMEEEQCWQVIHEIDVIGMQAFWMSCAVVTCVGLATDYYRRVYLPCRS